MRLYSTCDGASLFGEQGPPVYRIRGTGELEFREANRWVRGPSEDRPTWTRFCDLGDGGFLAFRFRYSERPLMPIVWVTDARARHGTRVADNLEQFLWRALDSTGRPYFQEPGFQSGGQIDL